MDSRPLGRGLALLPILLGMAAALAQVAAAPDAPPFRIAYADFPTPDTLTAIDPPWRGERDWDATVERWAATLGSTDPAQVLGALALLEDAPAPFRQRALARLRAPRGPLAGASEAVQRAIMNAAVEGRERLAEFAPDAVAALVGSAAQTRADSAIHLALQEIADSRRFARPVASAIVDLLQAGALDRDRTGEVTRQALARASDFAHERGRFTNWLAAAGDDARTEQRRAIARAFLLALGQRLDAEQVVAALKDHDPLARHTSLAYLRGHPDRLGDFGVEAAIAGVLEGNDVASWRSAYDLLEARDASALSSFRLAHPDGIASWDPVILADYIDRASDLDGRRFAELGVPPFSIEMMCQTAPLAIAILDRRARADLPVAQEMAQFASGWSAHCSREIAAGIRAHPALNAALAAAVEELLESDDRTLAMRMVGYGIRPTPAALTASGYWARAFASGAVPALKDVRIARVAGHAPELVIAALARAAGAKDKDLALEALLALGANGAALRPSSPVLGALADSEQARAAMIILADAYATTPLTAAPPIIPEDLFGDLLTRSDVEDVRPALVKSAIRFTPAIAQHWASTPNSDSVGDYCWTLAQLKEVPDPLAIETLNLAAGARGSDAVAYESCARMIASPGAAVARWLAAGGDRELDWSQPIAVLNAYLATRTLTASAAYHEQASDDLKRLVEDRQKTRLPQLLGFVAAAVPVSLLLHLALWLLLLTLYPRSRRIQAIVFWNPQVRKLLGLGYIDVILINVGFARSRLLAPFRGALLGDILGARDNQLDRIDYYPASWVRWLGRDRTAPDERPVVDALERRHGRLVLLGRSGLGKSSFLRFWLKQRAEAASDTIAYLRADECRLGVETEIARRMQQLGQDQHLVSALIYAGRMSVYIDGYNEVDLATQDVITRFLADYPRGNVLVASQIGLRGFSGSAGWEILPLAPAQREEFLGSRRAVLPAGAAVSGTAYEEVARSFLVHLGEQARDPDERAAFDEILANPMDLTSVALLLGDGRSPDLFALEAQQFDTVARRLAGEGTPFRTAAFAKALLEQRLADQENLAAIALRPEVPALIDAKLAIMRTFADAAGVVASQEVRFRHERIRDFFTHFAFLDLAPEEQAKHASDARFAGVFRYLARALRPDQALDLRERLIRSAAELDDHRVSDEFVREYDWRLRFATSTPAWIERFDDADARDAEAELRAHLATRLRLDTAIDSARDRITAGRALSSILFSVDPQELLDKTLKIFTSCGAGITLGAPPLVTPPASAAFAVAALAQAGALTGLQLDLALARLVAFPSRRLVVANSNGLLDPDQRPDDLSPDQRARLYAAGIACITARELYAAFAVSATEAGAFWKSVAERWP